MRRSILFVAVCALSAIFATQATQTESTRSTPPSSTSKLVVDRDVWVACAGEWVHLDGTLNVVSHVTQRSDGRLLIRQSFNPQGVRGVGETTSDVYIGTGATASTVVETTMGTSALSVDNFRLVGPADTPTLSVHVVTRVVVDESGVTTTLHQFDVSCD